MIASGGRREHRLTPEVGEWRSDLLPAPGGRDRRRPIPGRGSALDSFLAPGDRSRHAERAVAGVAPGRTLPLALRQRFERSLGVDLGAVRLHDGPASARAAEAVGARAFTVGNDIHFAGGELVLDRDSGVRLLAHEVAHTVQQAGLARRVQFKLAIGDSSDGAEQAADRAAEAMLRGEPAPIAVAAELGIARRIQRASAPADPSTSSLPAVDYRNEVQEEIFPLTGPLPSAPGLAAGDGAKGGASDGGKGSPGGPAAGAAWAALRGLARRVGQLWQSSRAPLETYVVERSTPPELARFLAEADRATADRRTDEDKDEPQKAGRGAARPSEAKTDGGGAAAAASPGAGGRRGATAEKKKEDESDAGEGAVKSAAAKSKTESALVALATPGMALGKSAKTIAAAKAAVKVKGAAEDPAAKGDTELVREAEEVLRALEPRLAGLVKAIAAAGKQIIQLQRLQQQPAGAQSGKERLAALEAVANETPWAAIEAAAAAARSCMAPLETNRRVDRAAGLSSALGAALRLAGEARNQSRVLRAAVTDDKAQGEGGQSKKAQAGGEKGSPEQERQEAAKRCGPMVERLISRLDRLRGEPPTLPAPDGPAAQGFALAKQADDPVAGAILKTAGLVKGTPKAVDGEAAKLKSIQRRLKAGNSKDKA